jgi:uncharacterized protein YeeX (DUF496 family)
MESKDYENMMVASINYTLAKESAKKGIRLEKANREEPEFKEIRPLYEIVNERIAKTLEPTITQGEYILLSKEMSMALDYAGENLLRQNYEDSIDYSIRIIEDCKLLKTMSYSFEDVRGLDMIIKRAEALKQKTEIMKQNPETGELMLNMKTCIAQEEFEEAARLKRKIERIEAKNSKKA